MRRVIVLALALLVLAVPTHAQTTYNRNPQLGNILNKTTASVSVTNTTTATALYSYTVPAFLVEQFATRNNGGQALHLKLLGNVSTQSANVGTVNMGCNFGGSTASVTAINAATLTSSLTAAPVEIDVWVHRISSTTVTLEQIQSAVQIQTAATTVVPFRAQAQGTSNLNSDNTLTCSWQWGSQTASNALTITSGVLVVGE